MASRLFQRRIFPSQSSRNRWRSPRPLRLRAGAAVAVLALALTACGNSSGGDVDEIAIDWAYYNPVSLVLMEQGILEDALADDGIDVTWVQSAGSNKALEFLAAGSVQFSSSAGAAALLARIAGTPLVSVYSYSKPEWTALVTTPETGILTVGDLAGKSVAVTRGTDPYIFLLRALADHGLSESDIEPVLLQHADGRNALITGQVDAWAGLDPMMADAEITDGAELFYRAPDLNTYGVLNVDEQFAEDHPEIVEKVIAAYEEGRAWALANPDELAAILADAAGLSIEVAQRQLERTDFSTPAIGEPQRSTILAAGIALQESGVIEGDVDVEQAVTDFLIERFSSAVTVSP